MSLPAIILPVFNAYEHLVACLESLDAHCPHAEVLVVNDASTDSRIQPLLQAWADSGQFRKLIVNTENRGFVHSANLGLSGCQNDVVLLNSDTVVTQGWLEALAACLASDVSIATATPWTNNGEIVSFPLFCAAAVVPENLAEIAAVIGQAGAPEYPVLPTAVGFCMAISRQAISQVGMFDEDTFGRGYGEENDFCMRAAQKGMKSVLCDNAYVAHAGNASFGPEGLKPDENSMGRLLQRHPGYQCLVATFIKDDPLAMRRNFLIDAVRSAGESIG